MTFKRNLFALLALALFPAAAQAAQDAQQAMQAQFATQDEGVADRCAVRVPHRHPVGVVPSLDGQ